MSNDGGTQVENQDDIEARVLAKFPKERGERAVEGPHQIGKYQISRVWTYHRADDEYHAHYHVRDGNEVRVFRDFSPMAVWLGHELDLRGNTEHYRRIDMIKTLVASGLVLGALGLVAFGFWKTPDVSKFVGTLITGVLLAAAGYLFAAATRRSRG